MEPIERADNLEFWSGRDRFADAGEAPERRARTVRRPPPGAGASRPRARVAAVVAGALGRVARVRRLATFASRTGPLGRRARPLAAAALLAALTAGWLATGQRSHAGAGAGADGPAVLLAPGDAPVPAAPTTVPPTTVPLTSGCTGLSAGRPAVRCIEGATEIEVRLFATGAVGDAYARATGTQPAPATGPPACAGGEPEERSWSEPAQPATVAGRYRCSLERGRAAMWWTHDSRLFHAVAADDDLARLFAWWRERTSE